MSAPELPDWLADSEAARSLWRLRHGMPPEPARLMHVIAECWPFAADERGIWLLAREYPLQTEPIAADGSPQDDIELELIRAQMFGDLALLHQTSTRIDGPAAVQTYVAVIRCDGPVRSCWPDALPMSPKVAGHVGKPPTHGAAEAPMVRQWDVVTHGLRHLAFQLGPAGDATLAEALDGNWGEHLAAWTPTLYQMYDRLHESA
jgi:hypothetical protein